MINTENYMKFPGTDLFFSKKDTKRIKKMLGGKINIVSTVCPDYANDGKEYTFWGEIGAGVSMTMMQHWKVIPSFIEELRKLNCTCSWKILLADLTNLTDSQKEFIKKVAGTNEEYLKRCQASADSIQNMIKNHGNVETFTKFYNRHGIEYSKIQQNTAKKVYDRSKDTDFRPRFESFALARAPLSKKLWGGDLPKEGYEIAAACGISLYATHGTLMRHIYANENLILINHSTINLQNIFSCEFVPGYEHLQTYPKFPIGLFSGKFY